MSKLCIRISYSTSNIIHKIFHTIWIQIELNQATTSESAKNKNEQNALFRAPTILFKLDLAILDSIIVNVIIRKIPMRIRKLWGSKIDNWKKGFIKTVENINKWWFLKLCIFEKPRWWKNQNSEKLKKLM